MNDIYNIKYKKYKKKYILLKQLIQQGGTGKFVGNGISGCLFCPPFNPGFLTIIKYFPPVPDFETYPEKGINLNFEEYNNCNYVGKIVALKQDSKVDYYEEEINILLKIQKLDPNGDYTPELIYANVHRKSELLQKLGNNYDKNIVQCINNKINKEFFGYIIFKHTGISLQSIYKNIDFLDPQSRIYYSNTADLKKFLINFFNRINKLLEFIKILYNNNYLHLDIRLDNITKDKNKFYLIDFGRTKIINYYEDIYDIIYRYLRQNNYIFSFEPKIYLNLLHYYNKNRITNISFDDLISFVNLNFYELIKPYDFIKIKQLYHILPLVFNLDFQLEKEKEKLKLNIFNYIYYRQKIYFIEYLNKRKQEYLKDADKNKIKDIKSLLNYIFYPIIKKHDLYCIGIMLSQVVLYHYKFNEEKFYDLTNNPEFLIFNKEFRILIKKLLFHEFDNVDEIISEIQKLIKILE